MLGEIYLTSNCVKPFFFFTTRCCEVLLVGDKQVAEYRWEFTVVKLCDGTALASPHTLNIAAFIVALVYLIGNNTIYI